jgi:hypothetical protein
MLLIESIVVAFAVVLALVLPERGWYCLKKPERILYELAHRKSAAVIVTGVAALALRAVLLPLEPIPQPIVHDEFSYLLMSDTFAHGRLANPTHPMWVHFETFYVNQKPTYVSKYFPGQGAALALGQVVFGKPFWGVWLSVGAMCAGITWMLQGWVSPHWALVGGLIAVIRLGSYSYWTNSYFGGALAATGGALVIGAYPRLLQHQRVADSFLLGLGFALLATTRPFEGMIFSVPIAFALAFWFCQNRIFRGNSVARVAGPLLLIIAITAAFLLYYCFRTTGNPFKTPYEVNLETQDPIPIFPWQHLRTIPQYHNTEMRNYFLGSVLQILQLARSHFVIYSFVRMVQFYLFFIGPALTLAFAGFLVKPDALAGSVKHCRMLQLVFWLSTLVLLLPIYYSPGYAAPLTGIIYLAIVLGMRRLRWWQWRHRPIGLAMARAVVLVCVAMLFVCSLVFATKSWTLSELPVTWCSPHLFEAYNRGSIEAALQAKPGKHLAIVSYNSNHFDKIDWVQNLADIDSQKVIWARDMGQASNEELVRYYRDRTPWLVKPDDRPATVSEYTVGNEMKAR